MIDNGKINIYSNKIPLEDIQAKLMDLEIQNSEKILFELLETEEGARSLDPTVLVAIISGSSALLGILIRGLLKIIENSKNQKVVIQSKGGAKIEVSADTSKEKLDEYIETAKKMDISSIII